MAEPSDRNTPAPDRTVLSVTELNRAARGLLESGLPLLWVQGEISNLSRPASGHLYFSLKDAGAQVRCALFRNRSALLRFRPADGAHVLLRARVSLYEPRGDFQLIVEHMEEAGHGALQRAFDELKKKLAAEGLFDADRKRPLPATPRTLGIVTSASGAALHDVLSVLRRRYPVARVILYPVPVQGEGAGAKIAAMLDTASRRGECDVLLLVRGGGSLEDLWAFNEEAVARAIRACAMPVVCGVGHEIDFTIADFAADLRAPTPTAAAELATPDMGNWLQSLRQSEARLWQRLASRLEHALERLEWLRDRLLQRHPGRVLLDRSQRLDELTLRLHRVTGHLLDRQQAQLATLMASLRGHSPIHRLNEMRSTVAAFRPRLWASMQGHLLNLQNRFTVMAGTLDAISPLATLGRGYAIVSDAATGSVLRNSAHARPGLMIRARLSKGSLLAEVKETRNEDEG